MPSYILINVFAFEGAFITHCLTIEFVDCNKLCRNLISLKMNRCLIFYWPIKGHSNHICVLYGR